MNRQGISGGSIGMRATVVVPHQILCTRQPLRADARYTTVQHPDQSRRAMVHFAYMTFRLDDVPAVYRDRAA